MPENPRQLPAEVLGISHMTVSNGNRRDETPAATRIKRHLLNLLTAASLVTCVATVVAWAGGSFVAYDPSHLSHHWLSLAIVHGHSGQYTTFHFPPWCWMRHGDIRENIRHVNSVLRADPHSCAAR
jgi:hypothetical protein